VAAIARRAHAARPDTLVIAESNLNDAKVVRRDGYACDATWADDFHHALHVLLTGEREGYYAHFGAVGQLAQAFDRPYVHPANAADDVEPERFVVFCQNHDQVGNRAFGDRLPPPVRRLAAFCSLLSPFTPMLFMGEEYGEDAPFQFFSDHIDAKIARATREGRRREFAAFAQFGREVPDPQDVATFERSKLTRRVDPAVRDLYGRLLETRRTLPAGPVATEHDEGERWLRVRRGASELLANFADAERRLPCASDVVLSTHDVEARGGAIVLPPFSGALIG
jgi:maltooligosyltrehalose trehalohydrolase